MLSAFNCVGTQPTLLSAPLAFSCCIFFGLYGPEKPGARIHVGSCGPQSLYGTPSRPTVQSRRGSSAMLADDFASRLSLRAFHVLRLESDSGSPFASTWKKFTRFCDGWWKPQQPKWLPECGKLSRSPVLALFPFGSPSFADAW